MAGTQSVSPVTRMIRSTVFFSEKVAMSKPMRMFFATRAKARR